MNADDRVRELGLVLPSAVVPIGSYLPTKRVADLLFVSGHGPLTRDGQFLKGKVDGDLDLAAAQGAARLTGLALLATLRAELVSLTMVSGIVKLFGMVNSSPGFTDAPSVIDGCSELLIEVFGDPGRHARSAVGVAELPRGIPVEIEIVVSINAEGRSAPT